MSWSITLEGSPDEIVAGLERLSGTLNGDSKVGFDAAMPSMVALLRQNYVVQPPPRDGETIPEPNLKLAAWGSGTNNLYGECRRVCRVCIEPIFPSV